MLNQWKRLRLGVLSFKSISRDILGHISLLLTTLTWITNFMAFQGLLLLEYVVVLKRTETFVFVVGLYARSPRIRLAS